MKNNDIVIEVCGGVVIDVYRQDGKQSLGFNYTILDWDCPENDDEQDK